MNARESRELGECLASLVQAGQIAEAYARLAPVLAERTPFSILGRIGEMVGVGPLEPVNSFLEYIAARGTMGGWAVIGCALGQQLERDLTGGFSRCRDFITFGDTWYATDILGERVPGPALVAHFYPSLDLLVPWREDGDHWVRRAVGVTIHFWAKRSRGFNEQAVNAEALLIFLEPMFEEQEVEAIKGVGWGLKTLGKYYPNLAADWLTEQVVSRKRRPRALMLHKALTYLPEEQRAGVLGRRS